MKGSSNILTLTVLITTAAMGFAAFLWVNPVLAGSLCLSGLYISCSPRLIKEWERGVILRLGKFRKVAGPGITWVLPGFDNIAQLVDMRIRSTPFAAEKTLTHDTVPVNVDAVLFWVVTDAKRAILEVERYRQTISWIAQTTLRDVIGKNQLARMISDRESLDVELRNIIEGKTAEWGISVQSVEIRDVVIPGELEDAMSRKAQADRERDARVILSQSEIKVAEQMEEAARIYQDNGLAMQLRAMNMTYESIKEKGALMVIPSEMVHSVNVGGMMGMATTALEPQT